ncbi:putative glutaredoxin, Thioredoxin-like superfamily [Helianthus annuus]|nr:putative glutaredoxin, Thioredoxin-like superfamily [Helianthus annuus]
MDRVKDLASKSAAVIFTKSTCCMCHSIKALFYDLGASPAVYEVDHDVDMEWAYVGWVLILRFSSVYRRQVYWFC